MRSISILEQQKIAATNGTWKSPLLQAGILGLAVFAASLFGIFTRPIGQLAAFWIANAVLLGLLVRNPSWSTPIGWIAAACGYIAADLIAGTAPGKALWLSSVNLAGVAAGLIVFRQFSNSIRLLNSPLSVLQMVLGLVGASAAGAIAGACSGIMMFDYDLLHTGILWFVTELVNYIAIVPVILTAPDLRLGQIERRQTAFRLATRISPLPFLALVVSCLGAKFIGGPGAVAVPVPALLWCAVSYGRFTTALLALAFSAYTLLALSTGFIGEAGTTHSGATLLSIRLGVMLVAITPITVASIMAARQELLDRLQHIADHDHLTGALNRRAFDERSQVAAGRLAEQSRPSAMLMLDIDHFKRLNDSFGHAAGDAVLITLAQVVQQNLRASDLFARFGGEEFAIMLPDCDQANALIIAERIRFAFAAAITLATDGTPVQATVSIGISGAPQSDAPLAYQLAMADKALYKAKANGRNQVALSTDGAA
ncbi:diguanylate cyclase [Ferrovibrio sp.]|uniref:sensor domain-containing diguanylate cyclase n=1 Tax=Ferrovibrio sp. TaxID=1917215 RepID=UPI003D0E456A